MPGVRGASVHAALAARGHKPLKHTASSRQLLPKVTTGRRNSNGYNPNRRLSIQSRNSAGSRRQSADEMNRPDPQIETNARRVSRTDGLPSFAKFTQEVRAATLIARAWRKRTRGTELDKHNFAERLMLEDAVCVGATRLILFVLLFIILYQVTLVGIPSGERRAAELVLMDTLNLEDFSAVRTLPAYRDEMVKFSSAIKEFSASGSQRFPDPDSIIIVGSATLYTKPSALTGLDLKTAAEEFTMSAWVEVTDESQADKPLLRKPMSTHPQLSCWGWYFPAKLKYGAQDFNAVGMDTIRDWQVTVDSGAKFPNVWFNHEAVVVRNHSVTFYRNGQELNPGGTELPRTITDCDGTIEIGTGGLRLSSVKFYARALNWAEIQEINMNGQPLSEIATGSSLRHYERDEHVEISAEVDRVAHHTDGLLEEQGVEGMLHDSVSNAELGEDAAAVDHSLFPPDTSPPATLPPSEPAEFLVEHERAAWEAGGALRELSGAVPDVWRCDAAVLPAYAHRRTSSATEVSVAAGNLYVPRLPYDKTTVCTPPADAGPGEAGPLPGEHWAIVEAPLYAKASRDAEEDIFHEGHDKAPLVPVNLSRVPADATALTFTFWVKAVRPRDVFSLMLRIGEYDELDILGFHLVSYGAAALRVTDDRGHTWHQLAEDMFAANQADGPLDEKFFITGFNHDALPSVWRHVGVVFHLDEGFHESFLDGRLVAKHSWHHVHHIPVALLQGKHLSILQAPWWHNANKTLAKVAQLRMYPRALSQMEVQNIQDNAVWPDGSKIKQCHEVNEDMFRDTDGVDSHGRSCSWYHEMMEHTGSNLICKSAEAKELCPLTCRGQRECSSGYPFDGHVYDDYHDWLRGHSHKHYRIFDRIMHLKPRSDDAWTLVCPGSSQRREELVAQCLDPERGNATYASQAHWYQTWEESIEDTWAEYHRADLAQCQQLEDRLDEHQCGWDDSWVPDFMLDLHEMEQFAVQWWSRPAKTSRLPVAALNFFSTMVPPRTLFDVREQNTLQEATTRLAVPTSDGQLWSSVRHRGTIDFPTHWTFYYVRYRRIATGKYTGEWEVCLAVNGFPLDCHHSPHLTDFDEHPGQPFPEVFLQGFEVATEAYVSPIEFSTDVLSVGEVQELYYRLAPKMAKVLGPRTTELERMAMRDTPPARATHSFSERLLLAAPPFLYQQRAIEEECQSNAMRIFLNKQLDLIRGTHCGDGGGHGDMCPNIHTTRDVYACSGRGTKQVTGQHYGQEATALNTTDPPTWVFADFLYSIADNDVLVRGVDHDILPAVEFVDRGTSEAYILCLFHSPDSGDTTVLDVKMVSDGSRVTVRPEFSHFGYLTAEDRETAVVLWVVFFVLCGITLLCNLMHLHELYHESRHFPDVGWDKFGVWECFYDVTQVVVLVGYGVWKLVVQMNSETEADELVVKFVQIPFRDSSETVQTKVDAFLDAITNMRSLLASEDLQQTLGFFTMVLMLIRIINATAVHPRIGVLIGTLREGVDDLWHFAILFLLVFVFSSMVSSWSFGTRPEFEDLQTSMRTQFDLLLGTLPKDYFDDNLLIIYVALSITVQFFLMLNFLLAIIVENYMKIRHHIEEMETENEIFYDVCFTLYFGLVGAVSGWPNRRRIGALLGHRCGRKSVCWLELHVLGVPRKTAMSMIQGYAAYDALPAVDAEREMDMDRVGSTLEKNSERLERLEATTGQMNSKLELLLEKMGVDTPSTTPTAHPIDSRHRRDQGLDHGPAHDRGSRSSGGGASEKGEAQRALKPPLLRASLPDPPALMTKPQATSNLVYKLPPMPDDASGLRRLQSDDTAQSGSSLHSLPDPHPVSPPHLDPFASPTHLAPLVDLAPPLEGAGPLLPLSSPQAPVLNHFTDAFAGGAAQGPNPFTDAVAEGAAAKTSEYMI